MNSHPMSASDAGKPANAPSVSETESAEQGAGATVSRRTMIGATATTAVAAAGLGAGALYVGEHGFGSGGSASDSTGGNHTDRSYPLRGEHQTGIVTAAQDYMYTAAFTITTTSADDLKRLMQKWLMASEQMMAGQLVGGKPSDNIQAVPLDTGEAWNYPPSSLTITVGVGKGLFVDEHGADRFGLKHKLPAVLDAGVPTFADEALVEADSGGDLLVQACADDAQVAGHAIRNLAKIAMGTATLKWTQTGFGRTSSTSTAQETPRNLFGFKDGTRNIKTEDSAEEKDLHLWVSDQDDPAAKWLDGGSFYIARRIRMFIEIWDRLRLIEQEQTIGRDKQYGAFLSYPHPTPDLEFSKPDFAAKATAQTATGAAVNAGDPLIPVDAHVSIVAPENNAGIRMLRRGYNYSDGNDSLGRLNSGLFFVAFVRDPRTGFYPILDKMTKNDALTEYIQHTSSALFAVLPGVRESDTMFGQKLFEG